MFAVSSGLFSSKHWSSKTFYRGRCKTDASSKQLATARILRKKLQIGAETFAGSWWARSSSIGFPQWFPRAPFWSQSCQRPNWHVRFPTQCGKHAQHGALLECLEKSHHVLCFCWKIFVTISFFSLGSSGNLCWIGGLHSRCDAKGKYHVCRELLHPKTDRNDQEH